MEIFAVIQRANKYIDETAPWALAKDEANKARLESVLYHLCEALRVCGILLNAYLPTTAPKMMEQLVWTHLLWTWPRPPTAHRRPTPCTRAKHCSPASTWQRKLPT